MLIERSEPTSNSIFTVRIKCTGQQDLVYMIIDDDWTFGNLITQSGYLWDLSTTDIYYLSLQSKSHSGGCLKLFPNDCKILPYLKRHVNMTEGRSMILFLKKYSSEIMAKNQGNFEMNCFIYLTSKTKTIQKWKITASMIHLSQLKLIKVRVLNV